MVYMGGKLPKTASDCRMCPRDAEFYRVCLQPDAAADAALTFYHKKIIGQPLPPDNFF